MICLGQSEVNVTRVSQSEASAVLPEPPASKLKSALETERLRSFSVSAAFVSIRFLKNLPMRAEYWPDQSDAVCHLNLSSRA